jgi:hypothetical protein
MCAGGDMAWEESAAACTNVAAGVTLDVLTASAGTVSVPQAMVTYARLAPVPVTWTFPVGLAENERAAFAVSMIVRFAAQPQGVQGKMRALPPLKTLPEDLFYPFTV